MDRFFNMDNKFFTFMSRVADLIILNLLCIVCCIPVVTIGPSIAAMFYVTLKMVRNEESYIVRGFFKSFKQNLKQGIVINLIMLAAALLLYFDISICRSTPGTIGKVLMVLFMMILVVYLMIFLYIYPVLAKFYNQEYFYQRIFDVHPPSSIYSTYDPCHCCPGSCIFYSKCPGTVHGHPAAGAHWIFRNCIHQFPFLCENF